MTSRRRGAPRKKTYKLTRKLHPFRSSKTKARAIRKINNILVKASRNNPTKNQYKNFRRTTRTNRLQDKVQRGKGIFSVLIPLLATVIGSAVGGR